MAQISCAKIYQKCKELGIYIQELFLVAYEIYMRGQVLELKSKYLIII